MQIKSLHLSRVLAVSLLLQFGLTLPVTPTPPPAPNPQDLPPPPYAIITYTSTQSPPQSVVAPCAKGIFALVGLQPDQIIQVTIQYPVVQPTPPNVLPHPNPWVVVPGALINAEPLDGGTVTVPTGGLVVSGNGTVSFTFQATHDPGVNQISLRQGFPAPASDSLPPTYGGVAFAPSRQELGLQFWVNDTANPQNNPAMITADDPSY